MKRADAFARVRAVLDEFAASRFSLGRTIAATSADSTVLSSIDQTLRPSDLRDCLENLEITYALRLFAEFETVLRDYWSVIRPSPRPRRTRVEILTDRVAARQQIPATVLSAAHAVREYRNNIVHDRLRTPRLTIHDCKSRIAFFISYLPVRWQDTE
jgi:hypothetical protein